MRLPDVFEWAAGRGNGPALAATDGSPGGKVQKPGGDAMATCAAKVTLCDSQVAFKLQAQHFHGQKRDPCHVFAP
jgi:hypothetical protein